MSILMELNDINCSICSSAKIKLYRIDNGYELLKCSDCKLVFTNRCQFSNYDSALNWWDSMATISNKEFYRQEAYIPFMEYVLSIILGKLKKESNIKALDIGCGTGTFLRLLNNNNIECYGIDSSKSMILKLKEKGIPNVKSGLFQLDSFPDITFDIITLWNVLEHVPNPKETINLCYKKLNYGGILFLKVPNILFHGTQTLIRNRTLGPKSHLFNFSYKSINILLNQSGFSKQSIILFDSKTNIVESCSSNKMFKSNVLINMKHFFAGISKVFFFMTLKTINIAPTLNFLVVK